MSTYQTILYVLAPNFRNVVEVLQMIRGIIPNPGKIKIKPLGVQKIKISVDKELGLLLQQGSQPGLRENININKNLARIIILIICRPF